MIDSTHWGDNNIPVVQYPLFAQFPQLKCVVVSLFSVYQFFRIRTCVGNLPLVTLDVMQCGIVQQKLACCIPHPDIIPSAGHCGGISGALTLQ